MSDYSGPFNMLFMALKVLFAACLVLLGTVIYLLVR